MDEMEFVILLMWHWHPDDGSNCWGTNRVLIRNDDNVDKNAQKAIMEYCHRHNMENSKNLSNNLIDEISNYKATIRCVEFSYNGNSYDEYGNQISNYIEVIAEYTDVYDGGLLPKSNYVM